MRCNSPAEAVLNQKGETLISVLLAIGLVAIAVGAAMAMFSLITKQQHTMMVKSSMQSQIEEMRMALAARGVCRLNLLNKSIPTASTGLSVDSLLYTNTAGTALGTQAFAKQNEVREGVRITEMRLVEPQVLASGTLLAKLRVTMQGVDLLGGDTVTRSIPVQLTYNSSNQITDCSSSVVSGAGDLAGCPANMVITTSGPFVYSAPSGLPAMVHGEIHSKVEPGSSCDPDYVTLTQCWNGAYKRLGTVQAKTSYSHCH